jgi:hypothetical protein
MVHMREIQEPVDERNGYNVMWLGVLMPPIAWLIQFQLRYSLVLWICHQQSRLALHLVSVVFFLIIASGGLVSWRTWVREGEQMPTDDGMAMAHERNVFLALMGILSSSLFALALIAQTVGEFMVNPCQD